MRRSKFNRAGIYRALTLLVASAVLVPLCHRAWSAEPAGNIVLIGGPTDAGDGVGEHDFPDGIRLLKEFLDASPDAAGVKVVAYPDGWPREASALEGASTIVFYFAGVDSHPLNDTPRRAQVEELLRHGTGVVALHQASTVPAHDTTIDLGRWLGGARYGVFDRTTETVAFTPIAHPIANGVGEFLLTDEFYPTIRFLPHDRRVTPILTGRLHPQYRDGQNLIIDKAESHPVAWAFERDDGGRAFTFTGLHYLADLDNPAIRKLLLNAILWTAKIDVPKEGVRTAARGDAAQTLLGQKLALANGAPRTIEEAIVRRPADNQVLEYPWGRLTWYVSSELRNSATMTVGEAIIRPGQENPRHFHPNCDEVLHVLRGSILNSAGEKKVELHAGDTVTIPAGVHHNARNVGAEDAVLSISYSSADRQAIGE